MNAGPIEEGAKVAHGVIAGLKEQPLSLALIVMNLVFVGLFGWMANEFNQRTTHQYAVKDELIVKLIDKCRDPSSMQQ
jgi:hypothetical protein